MNPTPTPPADENGFAAAMAWLSKHTDYEQKSPEALQRHAMDLTRMAWGIEALGHPQRHFACIHVTGSKGKGSTTHFADAILRAAGVRTGRFISPHILDIRERIAIDGLDIPERDFADFIDILRFHCDKVAPARPDLVPTFFEAMTLVAFLAFREAGVDAAVIEVGLGGRLDATNVIDPAVSVVTTVDLEHVRILGSTLEAIAREKAGIIKPGRPSIIGVPRESAPGRVLAAIAGERQSATQWLGEDIRIDHRPALEAGVQRFNVKIGRRVFENLEIAALGRHQVENAALALAAALTLEEFAPTPFTDECIRQGLREARLPARLELFRPGGASPAWLVNDLLLDSAHTRQSFRALVDVRESTFPRRGTSLMLGMLLDKDPVWVLEPLRKCFDRIVVVKVPSPRTAPARDLARSITQMCLTDEVTVWDDDPVRWLASPHSEDDLIVVAGSCYLAAHVRRALTVGLERGA